MTDPKNIAKKEVKCQPFGESREIGEQRKMAKNDTHAAMPNCSARTAVPTPNGMVTSDFCSLFTDMVSVSRSVHTVRHANCYPVQILQIIKRDPLIEFHLNSIGEPTINSFRQFLVLVAYKIPVGV